MWTPTQTLSAPPSCSGGKIQSRLPGWCDRLALCPVPRVLSPLRIHVHPSPCCWPAGSPGALAALRELGAAGSDFSWWSGARRTARGVSMERLLGPWGLEQSLHVHRRPPCVPFGLRTPPSRVSVLPTVKVPMRLILRLRASRGLALSTSIRGHKQKDYCRPRLSDRVLSF